jgi:hypothetical protein
MVLRRLKFGDGGSAVIQQLLGGNSAPIFVGVCKFVICSSSSVVDHSDMFKKFNANEDVAGRQNVKSSIQRAIRTKIIETFPLLEPHMEEIIPKKSQLSLIKWYD